MLSNSFKSAVRRAYAAATIYDIDEERKSYEILYPPTLFSIAIKYFGRPRKLSQEIAAAARHKDEWDDARTALVGILATTILSDRGKAIRLATIAARYAAGRSKQKFGYAHGYHIKDGRPIINSLYFAMYFYTKGIANNLAASIIVLDNSAIIASHKASTPYPIPNSVWNQTLSSLFYFARREKDTYDTDSCDYWKNLIEIAPSSIGLQEIRRAYSIIKRAVVKKTEKQLPTRNHLKSIVASKAAENHIQ